MQSWSRMAALALCAGIAIVVVSGPDVRADESKFPAPIANKVYLTVRITGLSKDGCIVEIKPGHSSCHFATITQTLDYRGQIRQLAVDAESSSADRDCLFAITVKEPGQPPKTYKRGLRLSMPVAGQPIPSQDMTCILRSPSLVAREDSNRKVK